MNWHFLTPAALWALPAALIPLVLHLLFQRPAKTMAWSDLRLLQEVLKQARPRKRLHEWLILLLRVLALACLFFFLSRPVLHLGGKQSSGDSLAMVLLVDASYSMQNRQAAVSNWERAVRMAEKALLSLGEKDRSALIVFSDKIEFNSGALGGRHMDLAEKLASFKPGGRTTRFLPAFEAAFRILSASPASVKSIMVLSDGAAHGWPEGFKNAEKLIKDFDGKVQLVFSKFPPQNRNIAISDIQVSPDFTGNRLKVEASIRSTGEESASGVPLSVETRPEDSSSFSRQSETVLSLKSGEMSSVSLNAPLIAGAAIQGRVLGGPDSLVADSAFYFTHSAPDKIRVLCVEEPSGVQALTGESFFLREALMAPPSPFEITTINISELKRINPASYDVITLVNPGGLDPGALDLLSEYQKKGGGIFVACGDRVARSGLEQILPVEFGNVIETGDLSVSAPAKLESGEDAEGALSGYDWDKVRVEKIVDPVLKDEASPFLVLSKGKPLLVYGSEGRTAVWMSTIDRKWTNAASKPVFAPLMRGLMGKLSQGNLGRSYLSLRIGEALRTKIGSEPPGSVSLISPSGKACPLKSSFREILSEPLEEAGIYALKVKGKTKDYVSVNLDPRTGESDCTPAKESQIKSLFPSSSVTWVESGENFQSQFISLLRGKEISRIFILAAVLFLLLEMVLASRRVRAVTALFLLGFLSWAECAVTPANRFILAQLRSGREAADWDPYPLVSQDILSFLQQTTSVKASPERRTVALTDPLLFQSPFLLFTGAGRVLWNREERENLKKFVFGGGLLFVENRAGEKGGSFDYSFRNEINEIFPEKTLKIIPRDHAVFRSFYLLRTVGGRRISNNYLEGLEIDGRVAVIYSQNDILGAWAKDLLGNFLFECSPGGEAQRWESQKLMMNIILYSVTGTYKTDIIHMPFIEEKLRN